jgi:hypothetical protein
MSLFLLSCADGGNVYNHLREQEVGRFHKVNYTNETNDVGKADTQGVYEHLNNNLLSRYCIGEFTEEEEYYAQLETRSIVEKNPSLCDSLPEEPLVFICDGEEIVYYSKNRCKAYFIEG